MPADWSSDRRLDILVLGPMGEDDTGPASTVPIHDALEALFREEAVQALLAARHILSATVHMPVGQDAPEIVDNVLRLLDTADLVVFNLTPKATQPDRANVFYELGLVHALGVPVMLVVLEGAEVPFYVQTTTQYRVPDFDLATLTGALRSPLRAFLTDGASFVNDRVSQFYRMPIVNISAAVGLATGYYFNFLARLITEGGFLEAYPDAYRHVVYVRPSSLETTYQADQQRLRRGLADVGLTLETSQLPAIPSDNKGPLWYDHVGGVVVDIPRAIYPLRRSPRLMSFLARHSRVSADQERGFAQRLSQIGESLLSDVENALRYQVRADVPSVRDEMLHFSTIEAAPALVQRLREA